MRRYVILEKRVGETPLMAIERWKEAYPEYKDMTACYAGRLDPMASGKLLVLFGDECKKKDRYSALDKEYEIEVLFDIGSDTGDALGIVAYAGRETRLHPRVLARVLRAERGMHERAYPAYSSKTVEGKPLFLHALEGTLRDIELPTHEERIYTIRILETALIEHGALKERVFAFLAKAPTTDEPSKALGADFRIKDVRKSWENLLMTAGERRFALVRLRVVCGAGTYMRSLAGRIGEALGTKALALSIRRTKIGRHLFGIFFPPFLHLWRYPSEGVC